MNDYLGRVRTLAPQIEVSADRIEQERRLPESLLVALVDAGLFRLLLPRSLDGAVPARAGTGHSDLLGASRPKVRETR